MPLKIEERKKQQLGGLTTPKPNGTEKHKNPMRQSLVKENRMHWVWVWVSIYPFYNTVKLKSQRNIHQTLKQIKNIMVDK